MIADCGLTKERASARVCRSLEEDDRAGVEKDLPQLGWGREEYPLDKDSRQRAGARAWGMKVGRKGHEDASRVRPCLISRGDGRCFRINKQSGGRGWGERDY